MARLPYRHRSENVIEIVRPTLWTRIEPKTRAIVTALGCLLGTGAAIVVYLFVGLPLLVLAAVATVIAIAWHNGKAAETVPSAPTPGGGERKTAS